LNLPQLISYLGSLAAQDQDPIMSRVKRIKPNPKLKKDEKAYAVFFTFDLDSQKIRIENPIPYDDDLPKRYYYFGNNQSAYLQSYLVRETESFHYLLKRTWNDLLIALRNHGLEHSELAGWIIRLEKEGFVKLGANKGQGELRLDRLFLPPSLSGFSNSLNLKNKSIQIGNKSLKFETFIRSVLEDENKKNRFVLVIPAIMERGKMTVLSQLEDFLTLVKRINKLENESSETKTEITDSKEQRVCYICLQQRPEVCSSYTTKFNRDEISKIFTTTKINFARNFTNYDDAYSICSGCYKNLLKGESFVQRQLKGSIARETALFLPEGLFESFDYESIGRIKDKVDFAFNSQDAKEWLESVEADASWLKHPLFVIHVVIYRAEGKSVTVLDTIEDVPVLRFLLLMQLFEQACDRIKPLLQGMSLGNIYRIIPVREIKRNNRIIQIDIWRILSLYKALILGHQIRSEILFDYACEALDKGMRQLSKEQPDNYRNMDLFAYLPDKSDFFIQRICMQYLVLIQTVQSLGLLDKRVFLQNADAKESVVMEDLSSMETMEAFLDSQGFVPEAKALFYLGVLLNRVASKQHSKDHKTKPVLKKVHFQGMSAKEVFRLYEDILDKLRQYEMFDLYNEQLISAFHRHCGNLEKKWPLSEHANVFYIMSGYGYQTSVLVELANRKKEEKNTTQPQQDQGTGSEKLEHVNS